MADGAGQLRQYSLCNAPTDGRWGLVGEPTEDLVVETTLDLTLQTSAEQQARVLERYHTIFVRAGAKLSDADKQKLRDLINANGWWPTLAKIAREKQIR